MTEPPRTHRPSMWARRPPTWSELYKTGVLLNAHLDHDCTLQELGDALGVSKQNAYTESVLALGKLAWLLRERLQLPHAKIADVRDVPGKRGL